MPHDRESPGTKKEGQEVALREEVGSQEISDTKSEERREEQGKERNIQNSHQLSSISSSESDQDNAEESQGRDLEGLSIVQSNSPPYSIFSKREKQFIVILAAWGGFFSPLSASIYIPALTTLARDFKVSDTLMNLTLTSYMIFQGLAPSIFGDLADMAGRRPAYAIGFFIYTGANIGLALQHSYPALFVLRCLQACGSSATIALGNGIVADVAVSSERGTWLGYVSSGPMIAPVVAPVIGGVLAEYLGWRSIFWFLVIMTLVYMIPFLIAFPETARNVVGNGSIPAQGWNMSLLNHLSARKIRKSEDDLTRTASQTTQSSLATKRRFRIPNPIGTLRVIKQKDAGLLLFYNSLVYTAFYDVLASTPYLFEEIYGFNDLYIGIALLPFGIGCILAPITAGRLMDWNYRRVAAASNFTIDKKRGDDLKNFPLERARIYVILPMLFLGTASLLCYGWTLEVETSLAAPLVLHFIMGLCLTGAFNCMSVMLIDYYPLRPSTASAANNLVRCWMGAAGTGIINIMIRAMGRGWCFTFHAGVVAGASPILWVLLRWGPGWREERRRGVEEGEKKESAKELENGKENSKEKEKENGKEKEHRLTSN